MITNTHGWVTSTVLLAGMALALPASAQRDPGTATPPAPAERTADPAPARGAQAGAVDPARKDVAPQRAAPGRDAELRQFAKDETAHRGNLAKLSRLRELYAAKGETARLAQIDELERAENARFDAMNAKARAALGDDTFRKAEAKLNTSRRRSAAAEAANAKRKPAGAVERPGDAVKPVDRPAAPAQADRPKPADRPNPPAQADRPKQGDRPNPPAQADRPKQGGDNKPAAKPDRGGTAAPKAGSRPTPAPADRPKTDQKPAGGTGGRSGGSNPRSL